MTKIMTFGAAALCAAVSLADVTSANVVGYQNYPLRNGATMTGASFQTITSEGVNLTDLTPVGYLNNATWTKNITGKGCEITK